MIPKKYSSMLNNTSIIREFAQYASKRAAEIGAENVFNYTIGNPSVPTTDDFNKGLIDLIQNEDSLALHGYSPTLTIYSVRKAVAESQLILSVMNLTFDKVSIALVNPTLPFVIPQFNVPFFTYSE